MRSAIIVLVLILAACSPQAEGGARVSPSAPSTGSPPRATQSILTYTRTFDGLELSWPCGVECSADEALNTSTNDTRFIRFRQPASTPVLYAGEEGFWVTFSTGPTFDVMWVFDRKGYAIRYYLPKAAARLKSGLADDKNQPTVRRGAQVAVAGAPIELFNATYAIDMQKFVLDPNTKLPDMAKTLDERVVDLHVSDFRR